MAAQGRGTRARVVWGIFLITSFLAVPSLVRAQTVHVVTTTDDAVGVPGQLSLRDAFHAANGDGDDSVIVLGAGLTYVLDHCGAVNHATNTFGALVHHSPDTLAVQGNGSTVVQTCPSERVMRSSDPDAVLTLEDLTLTGGDAFEIAQGPNLEPIGGGGGLSAFGPVFLTGVNLVDNHSEESGGGLRALREAVIVGSTISGNTAGFDAGGADIGLGHDPFVPHLTLVDSVVSDNAFNGLFLRHGTNAISSSTITGNAASGVFADHGIHDIESSTFSGNGGRGFSGLDASITVTGSTASNNGLGGIGTTGSGFVDLSASSVTGNGTTGVDHAGCNASENRDNVIVRNATVSDNGGYGVFHVGCGFTVVEAATISDNGGGVRCVTCERVTIENATVSGNAPEGGIHFEPGTDGFGGPLTIRESLVADNVSDGDGGGIRALTPLAGASGSVFIVDSTVTGNTASGYGGGLYTEVGTTILQSAFTQNATVDRAGRDGGGAFATGANLWIFLSTIEGNEAVGDGGGLALRAASPVHIIELIDSTVRANHAAGQGGGIFGANTNLLSMGNVIEDNTSVAQGGGFAGLDTSATFSTTTVSGNVASAVGGGVYMRDAALPGSELFVRNATFAGNAAPDGGGIFADLRPPGVVWVENATITGNAGSGIVAALSTVVDLDAATVVENGPHNLVTGAGGWLGTRQSVIALAEGGADCDVAATDSGGYNFDGDGSCGLGGGLGDVSGGGDPGLGPLADNGGATQTRAPLAGSPLMGMVPPLSCSQPWDQRFSPRPGGSGCEPGAFESGQAFQLPGGFVTVPGFPNRLDVFRLLPPGTMDPRTLDVVRGPDVGRVDVDRDEGVLVYTAPAGFFGEDAFTYRLCWTTDPDQCLDVEVPVEVVRSKGHVSGVGFFDAGGGRPALFSLAAFGSPMRNIGTCRIVDFFARTTVTCTRIVGVVTRGDETHVFAEGRVAGRFAHVRIDAIAGGHYDDYLSVTTSTGYVAEGPVLVGRIVMRPRFR